MGWRRCRWAFRKVIKRDKSTNRNHEREHFISFCSLKFASISPALTKPTPHTPSSKAAFHFDPIEGRSPQLPGAPAKLQPNDTFSNEKLDNFKYKTFPHLCITDVN